MIGQYLSNTNEIDTIHILPKILELNKASPSGMHCTAQHARTGTADGPWWLGACALFAQIFVGEPEQCDMELFPVDLICRFCSRSSMINRCALMNARVHPNSAAVPTRALFTFKKFLDFNIIVFLFFI